MRSQGYKFNLNWQKDFPFKKKRAELLAVTKQSGYSLIRDVSA